MLGPLAGLGDAGPIRLIGLRDTPLSLDELYAAVGDPAAGGTALFVGTVRDHDKPVVALTYSAHPSAERELRRVAEQVAAVFPVRALAAVHRTGRLLVGEGAVIVAVSCPHRAEAFAACRLLRTTSSTRCRFGNTRSSPTDRRSGSAPADRRRTSWPSCRIE